MSVENQTLLTYTMSAGEDLNDITKGLGVIWKAVDYDDGKISQSGVGAAGILRESGKAGQNITLNQVGESKYTAGAAVGAGAKLTVTGSGYMIIATSGSTVVGRNQNPAVGSGAIGRGLFNFGSPYFMTDSN